MVAKGVISNKTNLVTIQIMLLIKHKNAIFIHIIKFF